jgi:HK97 family phage major capsid protein
MRIVNTDTIEAEYRKKRDEAVTLYRKTIEACDAHDNGKDAEGKTLPAGRTMTPEERAAVQKIMDEATSIKARLVDAKTGDVLAAEIQKLTDGMTEPDRNETRRAVVKSLGQQWAESEGGKFFFQKRHHGTRNWSSPLVDLDEGPRRYNTTLTTQPGSGGALIIPQYLPGIVPLLFRPLTIRDLLATGVTDSPAIVYMLEQTFTNAAATVSEAAAKPESALVFNQVTEHVTKIAHWLPVTEEMLEDVSQIAAYIDTRLRLGLDLVEEDQLLNGNGVAPNLTGIINRTGVLTSALGAAPDTAADAIYRALVTVFTTSWVMPDAIVMNPINWKTITLMKDTLGRYIGGGPFDSPADQMLWGLRVVVTPVIAAGTALMGAFATQAQVWTRGTTRVEASNSHQDFFIKNLVAIRGERREALAVYRPSAFITITGLL